MSSLPRPPLLRPLLPRPPLPRLVALDLDGTLLSSGGLLGARAERAVRRLVEREVEVVVCTGRPTRSALPVIERLGLPGEAVIYNGAAFYTLTERRATFRHQLDASVAAEVIDRLRRAHPEVMTGIETHHGWYLDQRLVELRAPPSPPDGCGDVLDFIRDAVVKVFFRHPTLDSPTLGRTLDGLDVYRTWSSPALLEVMAPAVNKREALESLADAKGIAQGEIAAFGDQNNDREMLAWAGVGVAMANAAPEALAVADLVTASNDDDGVAVVLERWLDRGWEP